MWERSAPTPSVPTISYRDSSFTSGDAFRSRANGCPIPPAAPAHHQKLHQGIFDHHKHTVRSKLESLDSPVQMLVLWRGTAQLPEGLLTQDGHFGCRLNCSRGHPPLKSVRLHAKRSFRHSDESLPLFWCLRETRTFTNVRSMLYKAFQSIVHLSGTG